MIPFDFPKFKSQLPVMRDPRDPSPDAQEHSVTLAAPESESQQWERFDVPDAWCRLNVQHHAGERWNGRRDRHTGQFVFSFSSLNTATLFALTFRGV